MSGVLERFFQISLVVCLMLFTINITLVQFGPAMVGDDEAFDAITDVCNTSSEEYNSVKQTATEYNKPISKTPDWDCIFLQLLHYVDGYMHILDIIFFGELARIGAFLKLILGLFQAIGIAYIPFALWSAFVGGGSP